MSKRKKRLGFFEKFLLLILAMSFGFFLGVYEEEVKVFVQDHMPTIKTAARKSENVAKASFSWGRHKFFGSSDYHIDETNQTNTQSNISIATFHLSQFDNTSKSDQDLQAVAHILKYYDLIALQGVRDEKILKRTIKKLKTLGYRYAYELSPPVGRGVTYHYAFLFRKDLVQVIEKGKVFEDVHDKLIREPFYASFRSGQFDFTLINAHNISTPYHDVKRRELQELTRIYAMIQNQNPVENDVILLGNFSLPPHDRGWDRMKRMATLTHLFYHPQRSVIDDKLLVDNIILQKKFVKEFSGRIGVYRFDELMFENDDAQAHMMVSSHRPLHAVFNTLQPDDD